MARSQGVKPAPLHRYEVHWRVWAVGIVKRRFANLAAALEFGSAAVEYATDHRAFLTNKLTDELLERNHLNDWHATIGILMPTDALDVTDIKLSAIDEVDLQLARVRVRVRPAQEDTP